MLLFYLLVTKILLIMLNIESLKHKLIKLNYVEFSVLTFQLFSTYFKYVYNFIIVN